MDADERGLLLGMMGEFPWSWDEGERLSSDGGMGVDGMFDGVVRVLGETPKTACGTQALPELEVRG